MSDETAIIAFLTDLADLPEGYICADTALFSSQLLDSMILVALTSFLEESFAVKVKPMEIAFENFDTVALILNYLHRKKVAYA